MNKKTKTRWERLRFRRNVASGVAWLVLCVIIACGCNHLADMWTGTALVCIEEVR